MPTYVDPTSCNSCEDHHGGPLCVYICPNDLMILEHGSNKALNQEPEMCSECYACVKLCPQEAIHVRGYADFVPLGASVHPRRVENGLTWDITFRDGRKLQYTYPSRTKPSGSVRLYENFAEDPIYDLANQRLAGESLYLGIKDLPHPNFNQTEVD